MKKDAYGEAAVNFGEALMSQTDKQPIKALQPLAVQAFFSTRMGGVSQGPYSSMNLSVRTGDKPSDVRENFKRLKDLANNPPRWQFLSQVHGNKIIVDDGVFNGLCGEADGLVSHHKDVALSTFHADCYPIFMFCAKSGVVGIAHAGWKGVRMEIAKELVLSMVGLGAEKSAIQIVVGPGISTGAYEVSESLAEDFIGYFGSDVVERRGVKPHLNLTLCILKTLDNMKIERSQIDVSGLCTKGEPELFFSHRREGETTGRMMAVISRWPSKLDD